MLALAPRFPTNIPILSSGKLGVKVRVLPSVWRPSAVDAEVASFVVTAPWLIPWEPPKVRIRLLESEVPYFRAMVCPEARLKEGPSKFQTPPVLLANAVAMFEAKVVSSTEFPVASVIVRVFGFMVPVVSTRMEAACDAAMVAARMPRIANLVFVRIGDVF